MTKQGWIAVTLAIIFPSLALTIVVVSSTRTPHGPPPLLHNLPSPQVDGRAIHPWQRGRLPGHHDGLPHHGPRDRADQFNMVHMAREFSLTPAQIEKISAARGKLLAVEATLQGKLHARQIEFHKLLTSKKPNQTGVQKKLEEISALKLKLEKAAFQNHFQVRSLLTPEQQKRMDKKREHPMPRPGFAPPYPPMGRQPHGHGPQGWGEPPNMRGPAFGPHQRRGGVQCPRAPKPPIKSGETPKPMKPSTVMKKTNK